MKENMFSIGSVENVTGVSQKQLRFWEEKGYIFSVKRVQCGERHYRYYSAFQVDLISRIKGYLEEGFTLSAASEKAKAELKNYKGE